jgi:preprotein translocase subunit SecG
MPSTTVWLQNTLLVIQIGSALLLAALVLLHSPKQDGVGLGAVSQLFSSQRGAEAGLTRFTFWVSGVFLASSLVLGYWF